MHSQFFLENFSRRHLPNMLFQHIPLAVHPLGTRLLLISQPKNKRGVKNSSLFWTIPAANRKEEAEILVQEQIFYSTVWSAQSTPADRTGKRVQGLAWMLACHVCLNLLTHQRPWPVYLDLKSDLLHQIQTLTLSSLWLDPSVHLQVRHSK